MTTQARIPPFGLNKKCYSLRSGIVVVVHPKFNQFSWTAVFVLLSSTVEQGDGNQEKMKSEIRTLL